MAWKSPEDDNTRYTSNVITLNNLPHDLGKNKLLVKTEQVRSGILSLIIKYKQQA
jgi:hypothetical protein